MAETKLTEEMRNYLLSWTARSMPDNPTEQGWSASKIKQYQWKPVDLLFTYLKASERNLVSYINVNEEALKAEKKRAESAESRLSESVEALKGTKAGKSDTLAGYGIKDAYTKKEADTLFQERIPGITQEYDEATGLEEDDMVFVMRDGKTQVVRAKAMGIDDIDLTNILSK